MSLANRGKRQLSQQWLSVAGIALDGAGFVILLFEWWMAFFNEERQLGFQRHLEQQRNHRIFA
jgi:formate/nitrite transporter FocA (FNT family)